MRFMYLILATFVFLAACKDDPIDPNTQELHYDGPNLTGPVLPAGNHEAAARFTSAQTAPFDGKQMTAVRWFMGLRPQSCTVKIYAAGTAQLPGALLYSANISTQQIKEQDWTVHTLSPAIDITGQEMWISIAFTHAQAQQSIGCDAGPRKNDGDWLLQSTDSLWLPFNQRGPDQINWNIRGIIE